MNKITVEKVSNGYIVEWSKYLEVDERIDSQTTRGMIAVCLNIEALIKTIELAAKDVTRRYDAIKLGK